MTKPKNMTEAERRAARLRAKVASPWSRFAHCDTANAQRSHIRYLKRGKTP